MLRVQKHMCHTCIYRPGSLLDLATLERDIADPRMDGFFVGYRLCHHTDDADGVCCAGFWAAHKSDFTLGQLAQRLDCVEFVEIDTLKERLYGDLS